MTKAVLAAVGVVLAGCGGDARPRAGPDPSPTPVAYRAGSCPTTAPNGAGPEDFDYGENGLAVVLWPHGRLVAGRLPDGGSYADIKPDGSIVAKLGWWREAAGKLQITGARLDARAPALTADIPDGYGATGFQATAVRFPTTGCWKIVGSVGAARLTFIVRVTARRG